MIIRKRRQWARKTHSAAPQSGPSISTRHGTQKRHSHFATSKSSPFVDYAGFGNRRELGARASRAAQGPRPAPAPRNLPTLGRSSSSSARSLHPNATQLAPHRWHHPSCASFPLKFALTITLPLHSRRMFHLFASTPAPLAALFVSFSLHVLASLSRRCYFRLAMILFEARSDFGFYGVLWSFGFVFISSLLLWIGWHLWPFRDLELVNFGGLV